MGMNDKRSLIRLPLLSIRSSSQVNAKHIKTWHGGSRPWSIRKNSKLSSVVNTSCARKPPNSMVSLEWPTLILGRARSPCFLAKKYAELSSKEQAPQTQARAKNVSQSGDEQPGKGKETAEKKKEQEKPAKKEKAKEQDDAAAEADDTDEAYASEPKQKDPFAELPKTTFNMDEFKRVYSNEDTVEKALPYFWKNFDKENLSIWFCEYKYSDELTKVFMTCNLISGFYQRLDKLRKNGFGSMCVFGEDNNNTITGVWFWRGQGLAFEVTNSRDRFWFVFFLIVSYQLTCKSTMTPMHGRNSHLMMKRPSNSCINTSSGKVNTMAKSSTKARSSNKPLFPIMISSSKCNNKHKKEKKRLQTYFSCLF